MLKSRPRSIRSRPALVLEIAICAAIAPALPTARTGRTWPKPVAGRDSDVAWRAPHSISRAAADTAKEAVRAKEVLTQMRRKLKGAGPSAKAQSLPQRLTRYKAWANSRDEKNMDG